MARMLHTVVIGPEKIEQHLGGIAKFKADEVLLFCNDKSDYSVIRNTLSTMGIPYRVINCSNSYLDVYTKANEEAAASFVDDVVVAINVTTGSKIVQSAIEDAFRIQLISFFRRSGSMMSAAAFRYVVPNSKKDKIQIAPIWNIYSKDHNDIFETLANAEKSLPMKNIWDQIVAGREEITFESFRKIFREFKRWFKNTPYFEEKVKRGPEYRLKID